MTAHWDEPLLLIPGPVMVPPETLAAMSRQVIAHRGDPFAEMQDRIVARLRRLLDAPEEAGYEVGVYPSSGTGMLEAAVAHAVEPGDRVLSCTGGEFGERFAAIAERFGAQVDRLHVEPGQVPDPETVAERLRGGGYRALLLTHCETSTGALTDVRAVAAAARQASPDTLILVDAVSSLGGAPLLAAAWDIDAVASASQKALAVPPGLGILAGSPRLLERAAASRSPRVYWDLAAYGRNRRQRRAPYTPAVNLLYAMDVALERLENEGFEAAWARHRALRDQFRSGIARLGMEPVAADACASPTVTAVRPGPGLEAGGVIAALAERGILVAGGMGPLSGQVFRVGHMGAVEPRHLDRLLAALAEIAARG
ncbi:MAG: alanine--glyoxylate aminotransferase family protein [Thermaerobacter sp.]